MSHLLPGCKSDKLCKSFMYHPL
uniref:Uncharacterized protein n=1 Tax=Arundo donax TaxID=35708 RepID=A0A0A8XQX5_ARUDO